MNLIHLTPSWVKKLARKVVPEQTAERLHERALHDDYVPWMVSRDKPLARALKRAVGRKPHLHRLVVHITDHCNLNCKGCSHFSNISDASFEEVVDLDDDFERLSAIFEGITEIYLLGGEPLLHPEVTRFLEIARTWFPASRINLLTNGVLLTRMPDSFWQAVHDNGIWLMCNRYPIKLPTSEIEALVRKWDVQFEWMEPMTEFFKLPIDVTGSQDATRSFQNCGPLNNCVTLRRHRLYPCAYAAYGYIPAEKFGVEGLKAGAEDSIAIDGTFTPNEIFDFLCRPVPWCRFCDVDHISNYAWGHSKNELAEWTDEDPVPEGAAHAGSGSPPPPR